MEELVKIHDHKGQKVVSARELHEYLGSKRDFSNWIKDRIEKYGFIENQDYVTFNKIVERAKRIEYAITLDMAKELSMVESNEAGQIARRYFIDTEKKFKKSLSLPDFTNPAEAAIAWAEQYKQKELAEAKIKQLEPKASYADRVLEHDNQLVDIGQAAKLLKLPFGRNKFFERLRQDGIFFKNRNEPKQEYIERGYFDIRKKEIERDEHPGFTVLKVLVMPTGLFWLSKKYGGNYNTNLPTLSIQ